MVMKMRWTGGGGIGGGGEKWVAERSLRGLLDVVRSRHGGGRWRWESRGSYRRLRGWSCSSPERNRIRKVDWWKGI
jgi:hypothetical protein